MVASRHFGTRRYRGVEKIMTNDTTRKAALLERVPYTLAEFSRTSPQLVNKMISKGSLKTIRVGTSLRVPVTEHRRIAEAYVAQEEGICAAIAEAVEMGWLKEVGIDVNGYVSFVRTEVPCP
jgi:hypothetical protein